MHAAFKSIAINLYRQICRHRLLSYLAILAPWIILRSVGGISLVLVLCAADLLWIWRQTKTHLLSWLNAQLPELEDSAHCLFESEVQPPSGIAALQSQRMQARLHTVLTPERIALMARHLALHVLPGLRLVLMGSCLLGLAVYWLHPTITSQAALPAPNSVSVASTPPQLHLRITPPAYTGQVASQSAAKSLQVPEHSLVEWCLDRAISTAQHIRLSNGQDLLLQLNEQPNKQSNKQLEGQPDRPMTCARWEAGETVFWLWSADPAQTRYTLKVQLDQAPEIVIKEPSELLQVLNNQTPVIPMAVQITDDYQVQTASLHLTLARGSGENIRFSDKEIPIPQGADKRQRQWTKRWNLSELGMEAGDELYFFVRATDNAAKNPHIVTSPTYTIRLPSPEASTEEVSVLPILAKPESLRSQRQIIIDTEQLLADIAANPHLNPNLIRNRSEIIANDQAALRRRYGRFLGEESSLFGDEHEGEHAGEHAQEKASGDLAAQYGHAHDQEENATLFDEATKAILRRALVAMWDAEKALRAISPKAALAPENKALAAIKQLQQADRIYLHKAAFTPPAIKEEKRYSGDVLEVKNKQRTQSTWEPEVAPELRELILALGKQHALPALWTSTARHWIAANLKDDAQRLQAQASVQDVVDGCQPCRPVLAAWLRQAMLNQGVSLQAQSQFKASTPSPFERYWQQTLAAPIPAKSRPQP